MSIFKPRNIVLGGLAAAAVFGAFRNRDKVAGLIGVRSSAPEPWTPVTPASPPPPANADLPREDAGGAPPVSTVSEPAPAQSAVDEIEAIPPVIDEAAEEAAAAAEAAAIGGSTPTYSGLEAGQTADDAERAVIEGGGGEAEGQEQAEADLVSNAETSMGEPQPGYVSITDAIQAEDSPGRWEQVEPLASAAPEAAPAAEAAPEPEAAPAAEAAPEPAPAPEPEPEAAPAPETGAAGALPEDSGISAAPSWGERFRARVRERDEARAQGEAGDDAPSPEAAEPAPETSAEEKSSAVWQVPEDQPSGESLLAADEQPTVETEPVKSDDDEGSEWQTWSGRAIEP